MINDINQDTWCVNAYMNLDIHPSGMIKPCCMSNYEYKTDEGHTRLNQSSIMKFWDSKSRKTFIQGLNAGEKLKECSACWKEEESGKESKRIRDNRTYSDSITDENMLPIVMALSLGNLCNIKCRICSPIHSSIWMIEEAKLHHGNNFKEYFKNPMWIPFKESFSTENTFLWEDLKNMMSNVERLDFAGGEPFYIENHWEILKYCVENNLSSKITVHYNTNGTIFPEKYIDILNQFGCVDIQISSDGLYKQFEYLRHGANWDEVEKKNIDKFLKVKNQNLHWKIGVCLSLSAFNVFDFFDIFEHYAKKDLSIYINVVHDRSSIKVLPIEVKNTLIKKIFNTYSNYNSYVWDIEKNMICKHLEQTSYSSIDWKNFVEQLKLRDNIRNESFENTFPEYYKILKEYM